MITWDLQTILRLCTEAGSIALRYFDQPTKDYKEDESVVTQADHGIEEYLSREFDRPEEGSRLIGEETVSTRSEDYLLQGRMMAYVGQLKIWDFAGALPLLLNLGAVMSLADGTPIDGTVSNEIYHLDPNDPKRFSTRGDIIVAFDKATHVRLSEALGAVAEPA